MSQKLRILLADDHQMFRDALRSLLEKVPDFEVVAETGDGLEVIRLARETSPDIACMDIGMPGMNGIEVTRRLIAACPGVKVIALSAFTEQRYILNMLDAGALGYVAKAGAGDELRRAIEAVRHQRLYLCPHAAFVVAGALSGKSSSGKPSAAQLGARERQVLQLVAEGSTSAQIAERLNIAQSTVEVHRRNIMRKLNLHSVAELTRYAINNGLAPD
jgi:two-component system NarL family response regulator